MNSILKPLLPILAIITLVTPSAGDSLRLEQHPLENVGAVAEKAVGLVQGAGHLARKGVSTVGRAIEKSARSKMADKESEQNRSAGINCATAKLDLDTLEEERNYRALQFQRGVKSITPDRRAARILQGPYAKGERVEAAQYIYDIDERISDTRNICQVQ